MSGPRKPTAGDKRKPAEPSKTVVQQPDQQQILARERIARPRMTEILQSIITSSNPKEIAKSLKEISGYLFKDLTVEIPMEVVKFDDKTNLELGITENSGAYVNESYALMAAYVNCLRALVVKDIQAGGEKAAKQWVKVMDELFFGESNKNKMYKQHGDFKAMMAGIAGKDINSSATILGAISSCYIDAPPTSDKKKLREISDKYPAQFTKSIHAGSAFPLLDPELKYGDTDVMLLTALAKAEDNLKNKLVEEGEEKIAMFKQNQARSPSVPTEATHILELRALQAELPKLQKYKFVATPEIIQDVAKSINMYRPNDYLGIAQALRTAYAGTVWTELSKQAEKAQYQENFAFFDKVIDLLNLIKDRKTDADDAAIVTAWKKCWEDHLNPGDEMQSFLEASNGASQAVNLGNTEFLPLKQLNDLINRSEQVNFSKQILQQMQDSLTKSIINHNGIPGATSSIAYYVAVGPAGNKDAEPPLLKSINSEAKKLRAEASKKGTTIEFESADIKADKKAESPRKDQVSISREMARAALALAEAEAEAEAKNSQTRAQSAGKAGVPATEKMARARDDYAKRLEEFHKKLTGQLEQVATGQAYTNQLKAMAEQRKFAEKTTKPDNSKPAAASNQKSEASGRTFIKFYPGDKNTPSTQSNQEKLRDTQKLGKATRDLIIEEKSALAQSESKAPASKRRP